MVQRMTSPRTRLSQLISQETGPDGQYRHGRWAVRSPNAKGETVFRIFPQVVGGSIVPQYIDLEKVKEDPIEYISDAIMVAETSVCWGEAHSSFLSPKPSVLRAAGMATSPARTLYWQLWNQKEKDPQNTPAMVHALFRHEKGKGTPMQKPCDALFLQGVLVTHGGEPTKDRDGTPRPWFPILLQINQATARRELLGKLSTPVDPSKALAEDNNQLGSLLTLDGHCLKVIPRMVRTQTGDQTHYFCEAGPMMPLTPEQAAANFVDWEELLNFPTIERNIEYIAAALGAEITVRGLQGTPYQPYLTAELIERAARLAAPLPAAPPVQVPQPMYIMPPQQVPVMAPAPMLPLPPPASAYRVTSGSVPVQAAQPLTMGPPAGPGLGPLPPPVTIPGPLPPPQASAPAQPQRQRPQAAPLTLDQGIMAVDDENEEIEPFGAAQPLPDQQTLIRALHEANSRLKR